MSARSRLGCFDGHFNVQFPRGSSRLLSKCWCTFRFRLYIFLICKFRLYILESYRCRAGFALQVLDFLISCSFI